MSAATRFAVLAAAATVVAGCGSAASNHQASASKAFGSAQPPASVDTSSESYQMGLKSGTNGYAEIQAFGAMGASSPML